MRAEICRSYGPPTVADIRETPRPEPGAGEVLIRVVASSVNRTDCGIRGAKPPLVRLFYGLRRPRHATMGCEFAGEVEAVGPGVDRFAVGDRVFGFDDDRLGGHAEYVVKPDRGMIAVVPEGLTLAQAAVATEGAHYAGVTLRATDIGVESEVLVYGASGAIGSAAVQLAGHLGARVTAVCGTDAVDRVAALGPAEVIDYQVTDFTTLGPRFDLVFDTVGKTTFGACRPLLRPDGSFVATEFGPRFQNPLLVLVTRMLPGPRVRFPLPRRSHEAMTAIVDALEAGSYRPLVDRSYPFDQLVDAYRYVETGQKVGNVILLVDEPGDPGR